MPPAYLRAPPVVYRATTLPGCTGKRGYSSMAEAKWQFRRLPELKDAYHCKHCGLFHVSRQVGRDRDQGL